MTAITAPGLCEMSAPFSLRVSYARGGGGWGACERPILAAAEGKGRKAR